jgi:uncharacterized protein YycO
MNNTRLVAQLNPIPKLEWGDIILVKNKGLMYSIIRWRTLREWDHVSIFTGEEHITDARPKGVAKRPITILDGCYVMILRPIDKRNYEQGKEYIEAQIGKPYDFKALLGFIIDKDEANTKEKLYCFEFPQKPKDLFYFKKNCP